MHVSARTFPLIAHESISGGVAFSAIGTTLITAAEKTILLLINNATSTLTISVESVRVGLQGETGKPVTFKAYLGKKTYTSGGTLVTPVNLNAGSTNVIDVTTVQDNPTMGGTDSQFSQSFFEGTTTFDLDFSGAVTLIPSASMRMTITGDPVASGTKIALANIFYYQADSQAVV